MKRLLDLSYSLFASLYDRIRIGIALYWTDSELRKVAVRTGSLILVLLLLRSDIHDLKKILITLCLSLLMFLSGKRKIGDSPKEWIPLLMMAESLAEWKPESFIVWLLSYTFLNWKR
jgi:hypothetical protein